MRAASYLVLALPCCFFCLFEGEVVHCRIGKRRVQSAVARHFCAQPANALLDACPCIRAVVYGRCGSNLQAL